MSLRNKHTGRPGLMASSGGFSSRSMGTYSIPRVSSGASITPVTVNKSLLTPLKIDIDPTVQAVRTKEKDQIKTLNNRFVSFIDKVRFLEQENRKLDTKWKLLQGQSAPTSDCEPMLKAYISNLQRQLELLNNDKLRLDIENATMHKHVDDYKTKFENEFNKRNDAENEFVMLKKDVDTGYLSKVELGDRVSDTTDEFNFLTALYNTELRELQESLEETSVVVQMDNSRVLNMDRIVSDVRAQYEDIASRSKEDAEAWHQQKFNQMTAEANQYGSELQSTKRDISELTRIISRLQQEIEVVKVQRTSLDASVEDAEQRGEQAVLDAKSRIRDLEQALQRAKQDMARQVREYQELMNVKLALDIEISTYKKLLEGEEERLGQESVLSIQTLPGRTVREVDHHHHQQQRRRSAPILIKTVETQDRIY